MIILPVRYSDDPVVNATAARLVNNMAPNPFDWRGTNGDKTIAAIMESILKAFGDYAATVRVPVH